MTTFSYHVDIHEIFRRYNAASFVNMQIGYDWHIYILLNAEIPERIDGMFVPTESDSRYCVLALDADWDSGCITGESFYDLGVQKMNYHFVQKVHHDRKPEKDQSLSRQARFPVSCICIDLAPHMIYYRFG